MIAYQFNHIHYQYGNHQFTLSLSKLNLYSKKITVLVGENGSGKSTLLNLLSFLIVPQQGLLKFFGQPVSYKKSYQLRRRIGFLPQKPYLFRGSVKDNLTLVLKLHHVPKKQRDDKIGGLLAQLHISALATQKAKTLSGGELQKVALARALITQPKVLLMDEPFSYLDQDSTHLLEALVLKYHHQHKATVIMSAHNRLQGLIMADDVISLVKGRPIKSPLVNLFQGQMKYHYFYTRFLKILPTTVVDRATQISIDPRDIKLSRQSFDAGQHNQFQGQITAISQEHKLIKVSVNAGDIFQVLVTTQVIKLLNLQLGDQIWISFKSQSVVMF